MKRSHFDQWMEGKTPASVIETLKPYLTDRRQQRIEEKIRQRISSIRVAVEHPSDIHNALAIVRTGEAMGLTHVDLVAPEGKARKGWATSGGASTWIDLRFHKTLPSLVERIGGRTILAGASLDGDVSLTDLPLDQPICLLFGNECRGLSEEALDACQIKFKVPMWGMTQSLNLSVAAGISLYDVVSRKRAALNEKPELNPAVLSEERAWGYVQSCAPRLINALFS